MLDFRLLVVIGAISAIAALSGCNQTKAPQVPAGVEPTPEAPTFEAGLYGVGWKAVPLVNSDIIQIQQDGVLITSKGRHPVVSMQEVFPAEPGARYKVTVEFDLQRIEGKPVPDIIAWSLNGDGVAIEPKAFAAAFHPGVEVGARSITSTFVVGDKVKETDVEVTWGQTVKSLRFSSNPIRGSHGSVAKLRMIRVERVG